MAEFKCNNKECKAFNVTEDVPKTTIKIVDGKTVTIEALCPICKTMREEILPGGFASSFHGTDICNK